VERHLTAVAAEEGDLARHLPPLQELGPELVPARRIHGPRDLDPQPLAERLAAGDPEHLLAGAIPRDDAAVGVDRVEQHARLIEQPRLIPDELAGLEREQTVRQRQRELSTDDAD